MSVMASLLHLHCTLPSSSHSHPNSRIRHDLLLFNNNTPTRLRLPPKSHFKQQTVMMMMMGKLGLLRTTGSLRIMNSVTEDVGIRQDERSMAGAFLVDNVGPNPTVLDAQARVCTGPTQTRPLNRDQASKVLRAILLSAKQELSEGERVSAAQMGAFFGAMTVRACSFPENTQWSEGEHNAMKEFWPLLVQVLPPDVLFIADPEGLLSEGVSHAGLEFVGRGPPEMRLVGALREVLRGNHLGFEEQVGLLRDILPLKQNIGDALVAALLICQRMNGETDRELKAYCMAFDDELGPLPVADVRSLTHYGEPYDGNTRFFRSTLFVTAVRASYGETCLIHGMECMPPKSGITEGRILHELGASIKLPPKIAAKLLEDEDIGLAFITQKEARPSLYSLIDLRHHIKKRPTFATTEKVQQYVQATGREAMMAGYYHGGFQEPLLMLMRRRGVAAGLVIKGEEGALSLTTNALSPNQPGKGPAVNSCAGFRPISTPCSEGRELDGVLREPFSMSINAVDYGFEPTSTPRTDRSVTKNIHFGISALEGNKGPAYDRIIFNAAMTDMLLGCEGASTFSLALERAKEAVDSGRALSRLQKFIDASKKFG